MDALLFFRDLQTYGACGDVMQASLEREGLASQKTHNYGLYRLISVE